MDGGICHRRGRPLRSASGKPIAGIWDAVSANFSEIDAQPERPGRGNGCNDRQRQDGARRDALSYRNAELRCFNCPNPLAPMPDSER